MSVHVCVYDVGCFVDVLASRSGVLCEEAKCSNDRNTFSSSVGMSIK